jgi:hypothetical protein
MCRKKRAARKPPSLLSPGRVASRPVTQDLLPPPPAPPPQCLALGGAISLATGYDSSITSTTKLAPLAPFALLESGGADRSISNFVVAIPNAELRVSPVEKLSRAWESRQPACCPLYCVSRSSFAIISAR